MARRNDGRKRPSRQRVGVDGGRRSLVATAALAHQRARAMPIGGVPYAPASRDATRARGVAAGASDVESQLLGEVRATARVRPRALGLRYWQADSQGTADRPCFSLASFSSAFIARESCR